MAKKFVRDSSKGETHYRKFAQTRVETIRERSMRKACLPILACTLAIAACAPRVDMKSTLNAASEAPPTQSRGQGSAVARLDPNTNLLTYEVAYAGLTGPVTGAHFHGPAAPGSNAPVVVPFANVDKSPITGSASLTNAQVAQVRSGQWYVNLHTAANPNGEIRGQLTP